MNDKRIIHYIKLIRIEHSFKNILVFIPAFFDLKIFQSNTFFRVLIGFFIFTIVSSSIYVFNDIMDVNNDRIHEKKKQRPLAAGMVSIREAYVIMIALLILLLVVIGIAWNCFDIVEGYKWIGLYWLLNMAYSIKLKNVPIVDIAILAFGFVIRLLFGASIAMVPCSFWLYMTVMMLSFFMGLGKRRGELLVSGEEAYNSRDVLKHYSVSFLDKNMYMCLGLAVMFYALWSVSDTSIQKFGTDKQIWTVPIVLMIAMRYGMDLERGYGDPIEIIKNDRWLVLLVAVYVIILFYLFYI